MAHWWRDRRRVRRLEAELTEARLAALAMQLRPHFLLNALNTAAELVHGAPDAADDMITALGHLLWQSLRYDGRREIPLADELNLLRHYIAIERARFGDRLVIDWVVAPDTLSACVPPLLLQPLVENAVRHGIAPRSSRASDAVGGVVRILAERDGETLQVAIADDGVGFGRTGPATRGGVGLANVRARLAALYGARHTIEVTSRAGRGTTVTVRLPWRVPDPSLRAASPASGD